MRLKTPIAIAAAAMTLTLVMSGCGSSAENEASAPEIQAATLRGGASLDYTPQPSVRGVRDVVDYAVAGEVAAWHEGPLVTEGEGGSATDFAVLELGSTSVVKSKSKDVEPRFILVELGGYWVDEHDKIIEPNNGSSYTARTLADVKEAVPIGTRVLALGEEIGFADPDNPEYSAKILRDWKPDKGSVLFATHPQGLLLETADGRYDSGRVPLSEVSSDQWPASPDYKGSTEDGTFEALLRDVQQGS